ncbi:hypothetical protein AOQ84DRAFT_357528 [Glonium stellatum]|uniref:Uncharacterized protein n=1 Tax=Glonium stellatum TaxID=574774 RepID=A0A8E2ENU8_9PEZI|nr:hypothetical protein AOQ84DRAFT_357528 [Glonium stellatum]
MYAGISVSIKRLCNREIEGVGQPWCILKYLGFFRYSTRRIFLYFIVNFVLLPSIQSTNNSSR